MHTAGNIASPTALCSTGSSAATPGITSDFPLLGKGVFRRELWSSLLDMHFSEMEMFGKLGENLYMSHIPSWESRGDDRTQVPKPPYDHLLRPVTQLMY